jgi:hypothetical protein
VVVLLPAYMGGWRPASPGERTVSGCGTQHDASKLTKHVAVNAPDGWRVLWMPLRALTRAQGVSAIQSVHATPAC